ncbi:hypothetical protein RJ640_011306 [Escallonia rubra]|uniref:Reverse transcriptase Ty1/copia-type domain-containing protein n=1 Tax=Escallonia rubra TaxID=112253 RepID=A0AA88UDH7_9ASTE|nr:hypothetical protein RJ640_011306 [Escallonia rubra]
MTSLPAQFGPFKINYNTQKEKWKMNELISMRVQEEERLKSEQPDSAHITITGPSKGKGKCKKFGKGSVQGNKSAFVTKIDKASFSDDILLASTNMHMLHETKNFLSKNFDIKDLGEASYVIDIEIHRDRSRGILGLSPRAYIDKVLKRYNMHKCAPIVAPVVKGDKFSLLQCPRNQLEQDEIERIPYTSAIGSLIAKDQSMEEGSATTRPPLLKNDNYSHWKNRMGSFLKKETYVWYVIENGPIIPTKDGPNGTKYEAFKMKENESINEMYFSFTLITNELKLLGKVYPEMEMVRKVLRSFPKRWEVKLTAIQEATDLNLLKLEELVGYLMTHKITMKIHDEEETTSKKKILALKVEASHETKSSDDSDQDMTFITRKFKKFLANQRDGKMKKN